MKTMFNDEGESEMGDSSRKNVKVKTSIMTGDAAAVKRLDKQKLKKKYERMHPNYTRLVNEVKEILRKDLRKKRLKYQMLSNRVKDFDSLIGKAERQSCSQPFDEIEDICGARIVCLYREDLKLIDKMIRDRFSIVSADMKTEKVAEDQFRYESNHYIVKLGRAVRGPHYNGITNMRCEIQVRTILMDAWASVSHHMDYKTEIDIPEKLKRNFYALSGLFYVADTQFQLLKDERDKEMRKIRKQTRQKGFDITQELNLDTLIAYARWKWPKRRGPRTKGWSELLNSLTDFGYDSLVKVDRVVKRGYKAFEMFEESEKQKGFFQNIGVLRLSVAFANKKYRRRFYPHTAIFDNYRYLSEATKKA